MIILNRIDQEVKPIVAVLDEDDPAETGPDVDLPYDEDEALEQRALEEATIERFARLYGLTESK